MEVTPQSPFGQTVLEPGEGVPPSQPLMGHCQQCKADLPTGAHFCGKCGFPAVNEARPNEDASPNQPALTHTPSPQPGVLPVPPETTPVPEAPPPPYTAPLQQKKPPQGRQGKMPQRWRRWTLIALIMLLLGGSAPFLISWLPPVLPAATASVMLTPASQHLTKAYSINAVPGTPDTSQHQIQARVLSFTTQALAKTVEATGQGHQNATVAKGQLTYSAVTGTETIPSGARTTSRSGVTVFQLRSASIAPNTTTTVDAEAVIPGAAGNIPAYGINGRYSNAANPGISFYIQNTHAFTGGQDAYDYTYVQQNNIDAAGGSLVSQLTPAAQTAVQKQVHANEQFAGSPECTPTIKANHNANDRATAVTVTVSVTCKGEVYDAQAAHAMAADLLRRDAASQPGAHYALVGDMVIGTPQVLSTHANGTGILYVSAEGMWVYQFSEAQKQQLAQLITWKPLADAQALLLKQEGVGKVSITTAGGWGSALPTSPSTLKFSMVVVPGLRTTP